MQMQVEMAIDMIQRQCRGTEFLELSMNFRPQLLAQRLVEKITESDFGGVIAEFFCRVYQTRDFFRWQSGMAAKQG